MNHDWEFLLILSGDQLYRMDFREIISLHTEASADITIATIPVNRREASSLGIMQIDAGAADHAVRGEAGGASGAGFAKITPGVYSKLGIKGNGELFLASMGIYIFNRDVIRRLLDNTLPDFGKDIIPQAIQKLRVFSSFSKGIGRTLARSARFSRPTLT